MNPIKGDGVYAGEMNNTAVYGANDYVITDGQKNSLTFKYLFEFALSFGDRTTGSEGADAAAEYLSLFFMNNGYAPHTFEDKGLVDENGGMAFFVEGEKGKKIPAKNIVFSKESADNPAKLSVIIGAHYDNSTFDGNADGASDNASGIAVLLGLAEALKDVELDFNVIFTAFAAEEQGLLGSKYFVSKMSEKEKANTLLFVNLDCVSGGDKLYLYVDEVNRKHGKYLFDLSKDKNLFERFGEDLFMMPNDRIILVSDEFSGLPYMSYAMLSDHAPFFKAGMNIAYFMSANFDVKDTFDLRESKTHPNIVNTKNDNLKTYLEYYGESGHKKGDAVVDLLAAALVDNAFISVMRESRLTSRPYAFLYNDIFYAGIHVIAFCAVLTLIYFVYKKLDKMNGGGKDSEPDVKTAEDIVVFEEFNI
jgi:hypothetical protein